MRFLPSAAWALLALASSSRFATFAQEQRPAEVLYEQKLHDHPGPILVPTAFGPEKVVFILDTGAHYHYCDPVLKHLLGAPTTDRTPETLGGNMNASFHRAPTMRLGAFTLPDDVETGVTNFDIIRQASGFPVQGIIGAAAFARYAIWLDYDKGSLKILQPPYAVPPGMQTLPLFRSPDGIARPVIEATLGGEKLRWVLDLGSNGTLGIDKETYDKLLAAKCVKSTDTPLGFSVTPVGTQADARRGEFLEGTFLGRPLKGQTVNPDGRKLTLAEGNVGTAFLVNYNFIIDLAGGHLHYQMRQVPPPVREASMIGAAIFYHQGDAIVVKLRPGGGSMADAGIKERDRILRLGPITSGNFNMRALYELCRDHPGQTIDVTAHRPGQKELITTKLTIAETRYSLPELGKEEGKETPTPTKKEK